MAAAVGQFAVAPAGFDLSREAGLHVQFSLFSECCAYGGRNLPRENARNAAAGQHQSHTHLPPSYCLAGEPQADERPGIEAEGSRPGPTFPGRWQGLRQGWRVWWILSLWRGKVISRFFMDSTQQPSELFYKDPKKYRECLLHFALISLRSQILDLNCSQCMNHRVDQA